MNQAEILKAQIADLGKLTKAGWIAVLRFVEGGWDFVVRWRIPKYRLPALEAFIQEQKNAAWMAGALMSGRMRYRSIKQKENALGCGRIYLFPNPEAQIVLLVGIDQLESQERVFCRTLVKGFLSGSVTQSATDRDFFEIIETLTLEASYDLSVVLDQLLEVVSRYFGCDATCIGLKYGPNIRLEAASQLAGLSPESQIAISAHPSLLSTIQEGQSVRVDDIGGERACPLMPEFNAGSGSWIAVPLVVGSRVIGILCFLSANIEAFDEDHLRRAEVIANHVAPAIEKSVAFHELSQHLEKYALLNEIASAASMGLDPDEVAQRILRRLRKIFKTDLVSLLLLSPDGKTLQNFGRSLRRLSGGDRPVDASLAGYVAETGLPVRVGDINLAPRYLARHEGVRSELTVPLKYRGNVIGVMDIESVQPDAFSERDEQLLVVIASHLAGLIENIRLHEETRVRAMNLELIHQVSEQIVGLVDIPEISQAAAELMAERFDYELAVVILVDESGNNLIIEGVGGAGSHLIKRGFRNSSREGITGQVFRSGKSRLVNDTSLDPNYMVFSGWQAGSEMCVPLRVGEHIFGVLDVERVRKGAFTENDLIVLETISGMLSSVLMNAFRYQELQTNYRHLEAVRETAIDISADLDLDIVLQRVTTRVRELVGAKGAELGLVDGENQVVEIVVSENPWGKDDVGVKVPFSKGIAGTLAVKGESLLISNYAAWKNRIHQGHDPPFTSVAGVPLIFKDEVIGTLTVMNDEIGTSFDPEDLQLLESLAPQVAVSIRNASLYQELGASIEAEKLASERLVQSARLAAVGEMAAGVAHELNNPLTTVAGFVELVLDELPESSPQKADLELVMREARRAKEVVRRLLDFSRPGEGFRIRADMNDMVSEVIALIQHLAHTSGVKLRLELWHELPEIQVDRDQIKQVLLNLFQNALQAMPDGGVLNLQTMPHNRDRQEWVTVKIQDSGQGIHPDHIGRIFEPFFTTRPPGKGTGLGLAVSYGIIQDHGGSIEVESQPEDGSTFTVWLPVQSKRTYI